MFLENKYSKWYNTLCTEAQKRERPLNVYVEKHHIIPKSLGGSNEKGNLVFLSAKEHYIAHRLLIKCFNINTNEYLKMLKAFSMLSVRNQTMLRFCPSRMFVKAREIRSVAWNLNHPTKGTQRVMLFNPVSNVQTHVTSTNTSKINSLTSSGFILNSIRPISDITKQKQSKTRTGRKYSDNHRLAISQSRLGKPHPINSDKMRLPEERKKRSDNIKRYRQQASIYTFDLTFQNTHCVSVKTMVEAANFIGITPNDLRQKYRRRSKKDVSNNQPLIVNSITVTWSY